MQNERMTELDNQIGQGYELIKLMTEIKQSKGELPQTLAESMGDILEALTLSQLEHTITFLSLQSANITDTDLKKQYKDEIHGLIRLLMIYMQ